jgi:hypothetical protein
MILKRIVPLIVPYISTSMQSPGKGIKGYFAAKIMEKVNVECERKGIRQM